MFDNTCFATDVFENAVAPNLELVNSTNEIVRAISTSKSKVGDRPYRVKSVNISYETTLSQSVAIALLTAEGATHRL